MISDKTHLRPRYGEVDQMGYVYHGNYVGYCHQARTELLRKIGIPDSKIEENNIMLPVISFEINYKIPVYYDELITIETRITEIPKTRFHFKFSLYNEKGIITSEAHSTVVFVKKDSRMPIIAPEFVIQALEEQLKRVES